MMRDIREDLLQRRLGIVSRYFDAIARYDEQLQKLHEAHRKLMAELATEKGAVDAMLAVENSRPTGDLRDVDSPATTALLRNLSEIVQRYPWERSDTRESSGSKQEREATLMQHSEDRGESS
ncbi:MAG: hypothetical protein WAM55_03040 [Methylovirgula sp.]